VEELMGELARHHVDVLIDVRELPLSRKRGFSKSALAEKAASVKLEYLHLRELGSPRAIRKRLRDDGDYEAFASAYKEHLRAQKEVVGALTELVSQAVCCLLCYERDASQCHRSIVAAGVQQSSASPMKVIHI